MENLLQNIASGLWIVLGVYCFFGLMSAMAGLWAACIFTTRKKKPLKRGTGGLTMWRDNAEG